MKITLLTVGKTTNANLVSLQDEYQNRLKFYIPFEMVVIPELKNTKALSAEQQKIMDELMKKSGNNQKK